MHAASLLIAALSALLGGCVLVAAASAGNDEIATYRKVGDRYLIEVTGTRVGVSHDLSKHESYTDSCQFDVPRIEGKIDGQEIRPKKGFLPYVGSIKIRGKEMIVDLQADNYVYHKRERVGWNGRYTIVEKETHRGPEKGVKLCTLHSRERTSVHWTAAR
ncbi:MAG: hypothetical protein NTV51_01570 [Verrucomicrobia bacterium]|nr:hypothetical protein [Verrucomicrobiota bacterium]